MSKFGARKRSGLHGTCLNSAIHVERVAKGVVRTLLASTKLVTRKLRLPEFPGVSTGELHVYHLCRTAEPPLA